MELRCQIHHLPGSERDLWMSWLQKIYPNGIPTTHGKVKFLITDENPDCHLIFVPTSPNLKDLGEMLLTGKVLIVGTYETEISEFIRDRDLRYIGISVPDNYNLEVPLLWLIRKVLNRQIHLLE